MSIDKLWRRWSGETVVIVGGGPSLTADDVAFCRGRARVVVINDGYKLAPWADLLYACDDAWWNRHDGAGGFAGERWTCSRKSAERWGLRWISAEHRRGLSTSRKFIHFGRHSGYQALNLVALTGPAKIVLLGFDCCAEGDRTHWFGEHPGKIEVKRDFEAWRRWIDGAASPLAAMGIVAVNASRRSALTAFSRMTIEQALAV